MSMLTIDGVAISPDPSVYSLPEHDLDSENSGRNELGVLIRDRLRQGVYKIELEWWAISNAELKVILGAIYKPEFPVTFLTEDGYVTKTMYAGDRSKSLVRYMGDTNKMAWNLKFNLIEC